MPTNKKPAPKKSPRSTARAAGSAPSRASTSAPRAAAGSSEPRIEWVSVDDLEPTPGNPKLHSITAIRESFTRFGFVDPIVVDERSGRIVAGHGRREALQAMRAAGEAPPRNVRAQGKVWRAPVLRGVSFASEREAQSYLVGSNRIVELGAWDEQALAKMLGGLGGELLGTGWGEKELVQFMAHVSKQDPNNVEFPEYGDDAANHVVMIECPHCKKEFPR